MEELKLQTPVLVGRSRVEVSPDDKICVLGSCFADNIGDKMAELGFNACVNPFGTLYTPLSLAEDLQMALAGEPLDPALLVQHEDLWHSWMHHSRFSSPDRDECLGRCNQAIQEAHDQLQRHPLLIVTFGTAWVFRHEGRLVANCHKIPPQQFTRTRLSIDEIVDVWQPLTERLHAEGIQTIFTVSPVRHLADTAHGNQLSKSTLLLAVDRIDTHYFDSYEILLDELRDYRFFGRDMCHPSDLAADIVYERFLDTYTTPATRQQALLFRKEALRAGHRTIVETKN